jgi:hypothetical protein
MFLPTAIILVVVGWGGLLFLVTSALPTIGPRWLFYFLFFLALTGTVMPFVAFLNRRFPTTPPASPGVILRQAMLFGIYWATLAWLQSGRVLTSALGLLLALGFLLMEWLLRLRERSQWKP